MSLQKSKHNFYPEQTQRVITKDVNVKGKEAKPFTQPRVYKNDGGLLALRRWREEYPHYRHLSGADKKAQDRFLELLKDY